VPGPADSSEKTVRLWRRIFLGLYLTFTLGVCLLAFLSILAYQLGAHEPPVKRGRRIMASADNPKELRDCHKRLERLATELHKETFTLQIKALKFKRNDPATEWRNWSTGWKHRWRRLNYRCRLSELSGQGISTEIDKMAAIHRSLDDLQLSYSGVVNTFVERYVDRLRRLRSELTGVRGLIDRRKHQGVAPTGPSGVMQ
jgi:hypothetical protein